MYMYSACMPLMCNALPQEFDYLTVEMLDDATQDVLAHYPKCEKFINEGREKGSVLIHW